MGIQAETSPSALPEITVSASRGGTNFDDFDQLEASQKEVEKVAQAKEVKAKEGHKKLEEKIKEQVDGKSPEKLTEGDKDEKDSEEAKPEENSDKEANAEQESPEAKPKKVIKLGDTELDSETLVPVKVDGKIVDVPLQELINNHSGKLAIDKRFTDLDKRSKEFSTKERKFKEELDVVSTHLKDVAGKFKSALNDKNVNPLDAVDYMLDIIGENGNNYYNRILEHLWPTFETLYNADDVSREAFFVKKENEYLRKKADRQQSLSSESQAKSQRAKELDNQRQQIGITEEEFVDLHEEMSKRSNGQKIEPKQVLEAATRMKAMQKARAVAEKVDPSKLESREALVELADAILEDPSVPESDLIDILRDHWKVPTSQEKAVNEKLQKLPQKKASTPKVAGNTKRGFESFDDYER